jgi:hypothetical protein
LEVCVQVLPTIAIEFGFLGTIICLFKVNQSNKDLFVFIFHRSINVKMDKHEDILDMQEDPTIMILAFKSYRMCNKLKDNWMRVGMQRRKGLIHGNV